MPRAQSTFVSTAPVRPAADIGKGELHVSLSRIGEPYRPRTATEKEAWGNLIKDAVGGVLSIGEKIGATSKEVEEVIEVLGIRDLYDMSLGEGAR